MVADVKSAVVSVLLIANNSIMRRSSRKPESCMAISSTIARLNTKTLRQKL